MEENSELRLLKAIVVFRHGDRTPATALDSNTLEKSYWHLQLPSFELRQRLNKIFPISWKLLTVLPKLSYDEKAEGFVRRYRYSTLNNENLRELSKEDAKIIDEKKDLVETLLFEPMDDKSPIFKKHKYRGQLTTTGFFQMQQFGLFLRQRYVDSLNFLPKLSPSYNVSKGDEVDEEKETFKLTDLIYVRSTSFPRTIQSAQNVLIGLFSSNINPWWLSLTRTLLPIHVLPPLQENMLPNYSTCRNLEIYHRIIYNKVDRYVNSLKTKGTSFLGKKIEALDNIYDIHSLPINSDSLQQFSITELENTTRKIFKLNENDRIRWVEINDKLACLLHHNLPTDSLVTPIYYDRVKSFTIWKFVQLYSHPTLCRLAIGSFIGEIVEKFNNVIFDQNNKNATHIHPKLEIFAGHDSTLIPLFCSFNVFDGLWPDYGTSLIIELWERKTSDDNINGGNDRYFVKFLVNGKEKEQLVTYKEFEELTDPLIPTDYEAECTIRRDG